MKSKKPKVAIPPAAEQRHRIEYMGLRALLAFPKNPRAHDLAALGEAFEVNGFVTPPLIDETSGLLVEGNGRFEKLKALRDAGEKPPARIEVRDDGEWYVPIVRGIWFDDLEQATRHLLAANRIGEGLWDGRLTANMLGKLGDDGLAGTGFYKEDTAKFLALVRDPWKSDIDLVNKAGSHTDGIPGKIVITCPAKKKDELREAILSTIKRRGFRGVEVA